MKPSEIDIVAGVIQVIRPDWNMTTIRATLNRPHVSAQDYRRTLVAAVICVTEGRAARPPFFAEAGDWWTQAAQALPISTERPQPPKPAELCVCGRPQHDPNPACDEPRQASRQRPPTRAEINAGLAAVRRSLRERKAADA